MELSDLSPDEQLALIGLVKQIVRADGVLSDDERAALDDLAEQVGRDRWASSLSRARDELTSREALDAAVHAVERDEARQAIYRTLVGIAGSDELVAQEARIIDHVARLWDLGDEAPLAPPNLE